MIAHCLEEDAPFGIVFRDDDGAAIGRLHRATSTEVVERFDDGRMDIVVTGGDPFRVLDRFEAAKYPAGQVDARRPGRARSHGRRGAAGGARRASPSCSSGRRPPEERARRAMTAYAIAAQVEMPPTEKQALLEPATSASGCCMLERHAAAARSPALEAREPASARRPTARAGDRPDPGRPAVVIGVTGATADARRSATAPPRRGSPRRRRRVARRCDRVDAAEEEVRRCQRTTS